MSFFRKFLRPPAEEVEPVEQQMADTELAAFLGIAGKKGCDQILKSITPRKRAVYEHMAQVEKELRLWQHGKGPKPENVIVCERPKRKRKRRA